MLETDSLSGNVNIVRLKVGANGRLQLCFPAPTVMLSLSPREALALSIALRITAADMAPEVDAAFHQELLNGLSKFPPKEF
jgi:hypothetical protein